MTREDFSILTIDRERGGLREQAGKICAKQCTGTLGEAVLRAGHSGDLQQ